MLNQNENQSNFHYEFRINASELEKIDSVCNSLGYISGKTLSSFNNSARLEENQLELSRLEEKKDAYDKMLIKIDSVKSEKYYQHWEKIREIESQIYNTKRAIAQFAEVQDIYSIYLDLNEERAAASSSRINFVHMPGVEYVHLITENPKSGVSSASYQGVFLKYLFTSGKSYFSLGALKPSPGLAKDSTTYDDIFTFAFGQDWYSRHLGRGGKKFMNLYIGYQAGLSLAYSQTSSIKLPYLSPTTGVELFKNKFLLVDVNCGYYLPISDLNRDLRGWRLGGSVNFSF